MKFQSLFSGKNEKNISKFCLVNFLPTMLSIKHHWLLKSTDFFIYLFFFFISPWKHILRYSLEVPR